MLVHQDTRNTETVSHYIHHFAFLIRKKKYPNLFTILCGVDAITPDVTNEKLFIL